MFNLSRDLLTYPEAIWLLAALALLLALAVVAVLRRRRALRRFGAGLELHALAPARRWAAARGLCAAGALLATVIAIAGPRWGVDATQQAVSGRDLVVALDLSRSMTAEQPSRQERARRALVDLTDFLTLRGGHRVGLVVFSGRPKLVCPLTRDYDHFREAVLRADAGDLPPDLWPAAEGASGTRTGAALRMAVAAFEAGREGLQDILLISDGDDPADDGEWEGGAKAARAMKIPVHCLGIGDLATAQSIPTSDGPLRHDGKEVRTRLEEEPLKEIARRTGGTYYPLRTNDPERGALFRQLLARQGSGAREVELPSAHPRYPWFFGAALVLLAGSLLLGAPLRRRPKGTQAPTRG